MSSTVPLAEWERAEIVRSDSEAAATASLRLGKRNLARYLAPPAASPYPLEYVFTFSGMSRGFASSTSDAAQGSTPCLLRSAAPAHLALTSRNLL